MFITFQIISILQRDATNVTKNVKINLDLVHFVQIYFVTNPKHLFTVFSTRYFSPSDGKERFIFVR
jgi:hypothetical protein